MTGLVREIEAKSILRRQKRIDSWFVAPYGMNLYRGCTHGCVYCDGRSERYYVDGEFGRDVTVKINAVELLRRELDPARRRKALARGYVFLGGGVGDSYQSAEETYRLARGALEIMLERGRPAPPRAPPPSAGAVLGSARGQRQDLGGPGACRLPAADPGPALALRIGGSRRELPSGTPGRRPGTGRGAPAPEGDRSSGAAKLIAELLDTGRSRLYEALLRPWVG